MRIDRAKLAYELARRDMNIKKLAEISGLSKMTISGVRNGKSCSETTARKIAQCFNVDIESLLEDHM